ncbi:MAG TPA: glycine zipper 2TM domain-containing protein [Nevskia sp.]|jgi:outer membrane lipoprotein SlyB|nr:glycine zipper 2TM domain-containing protein [Nevskia sp.]
MSTKQVLMLLGITAVVSACGPSSNAPQDQNPPPQNAAPAAVPPPAAAPAPSANDEQIAKLREEQHRLERRQRQLAEEEASRRAASQAPPPCSDCGVVSSVTPVRKEGQAGWAGTLGGAAAGGLAGNQFGKGKGNIAMTALGVVGGAFAGREVEKQVTADTVYQVAVNMDSGGQRVVTVANGQGLAPGTKVHVDGNSLLPY